MAQHELMATAVEAHGVICGLVCGGVALDDKRAGCPISTI